MTLFLTVSAGLFWFLVIWLFLNTVRRQPSVQKFMDRPTFYPYTHYLEQKYIGFVLMLQHKIGLSRSSPDFIRSMRSVKLSQMKALRDAYKRVDELPTVKQGNETLGLKSVFEIRSKRVRFIKSSYTHRLQNPPFFLPGIPATPFYDPSDFEWVTELEESYSIIKKELSNLLNNDGAGFKTYVDETAGMATGWNTFNFFFFGKKYEENCERCPKKTAILESLPNFEKDHIMFSALNPHTVIPPHFGPMNGIVRAHLPLIVPDGCYIKVGDEERTWREGKVMAFDDSFLHQVWNHSDHLRIVLFLNFWHPCFSPQEIPVLEDFRRAYENHPIATQHAHNQARARSHNIKKSSRRDLKTANPRMVSIR